MRKLISYLMLLICVNSCSLGRVGLLDSYTFSEEHTQLMEASDKMANSSKTIIRYHDQTMEDYYHGEYRVYRVLCGEQDTLFVSLRFMESNPSIQPDSLKRIGVKTYIYHDVIINTDMDRKDFRKNEILLDSCRACFERVFLYPLKNSLE